MDSPCLRVPRESSTVAEVVTPVHDCWLLVTTLVDRQQLHCLELDRQAHYSAHGRWGRFDHQRASKKVTAVRKEIVDLEMGVESSYSGIHLLQQNYY